MYYNIMRRVMKLKLQNLFHENCTYTKYESKKYGEELQGLSPLK